MMTGEALVESLKRCGYRTFTGVPCSFFQAAINRVIEDTDLRYTIVPNEGAALALAAGAHLAGEAAVVMIQNSGLGNLINPLTSLNMIYRLPVLLLISGRAYGVPDEPQHEIIGRTMPQLLDAIGIPHEDLPAEPVACEEALQRATAWMQRERLPFAFFVRKGTLAPDATPRVARADYPLKRIDAIRIIVDSLRGDERVVVTTGKPSRELFSIRDRAEHFYMQGAMGHAAAVGLGVALSQPRTSVVVLDGDGALLMHLGILSTIGHYRPNNFYHLVLDNESYESTGDQDTTSATTDFVAIAKACGYASAQEVVSEAQLRATLTALLRQPGPALLRIKINRLPTPGIPRITSKHTSPEIAAAFQASLGALSR